MGRIAVLGEPPRVDPWVLAGALVVPALGVDAVQRAWAGLPGDIDVVVLTPSAATHLGSRASERLVVVLP